MKKLLTTITAFALLASCSKDETVPQTCGFAFEKFYQNPPADTTLANRTYWIRMASDTVPPGITNWVIQVPKNVYDTMLRSGKPAVLYCY